jgi:hypothetical protein
MVGRRIARFLICNIVPAVKSKATWLIAENRARSIRRRSCRIFGCAASAFLSKMYIILRT